MNKGFLDLGLRAELVSGLEKMGITVPTAIQAEMIPYGLDNKDVIGESQTGSGKTLGYLLPIFHRVDTEKKENQAIILAPTHELTMQIEKVARELAEKSGLPVRVQSIIGNVNVDRQIEKLREKPHIIVGTPGRILELIKKKKIAAHLVKTIVVDEGDRMLDRNNADQVKAVIKTTLRDRQLILVSATISERVKSDASDLMKEAVVLRVKEELKVSETIEHWYLEVEKRDKAEVLRKLLHAVKPKRAIVFINTAEEVQQVEDKLRFHKVDVYGLHGAAKKEERKNAMEAFRSGKLSVLLASDIGARGLDVKGISHVINYELPEKAADYMHRTGRTGRQGEHGIAVTLATSAEIETLRKFSREGKFNIIEKELRNGKAVDVENVD